MEVIINKEIFDRLKEKVKEERLVSLKLMFGDETVAECIAEGLKNETSEFGREKYSVKIEQLTKPRRIGDKD